MRAAEFLIEKAVESSWITDIVYNRPNRVLTMRMSDGKAYSVPNITRTTFEQWLKAPSKGQFFHRYIKDVYPVKRIV